MPVFVYSVLRLALLAVTWLLLTWAGLRPLAALLVAAFVAWGLSYAALGGQRDAAARHLAERAALRAAHAGRPVLSAHAREDADVEDAAVDAALASRRPAAPEGAGAAGTDERLPGDIRADGPSPIASPAVPSTPSGPDSAGRTAQSASPRPSSTP